MRGYPKHLATKDDYLYVKENFPKEQWQADWQELYDSRVAWFPTGELAFPSAGVTDATHRVGEDTDIESDVTTYTQYELRENPNGRLFRLGFTVDEVEAALR